jgi:hypothetical protein
MKIKLKSGIIFGFCNIRAFCLAGLLGKVLGESHIMLILFGLKIVTQGEGTYCCICVQYIRRDENDCSNVSEETFMPTP